MEERGHASPSEMASFTQHSQSDGTARPAARSRQACGEEASGDEDDDDDEDLEEGGLPCMVAKSLKDVAVSASMVVRGRTSDVGGARDWASPLD